MCEGDSRHSGDGDVGGRCKEQTSSNVQSGEDGS